MWRHERTGRPLGSEIFVEKVGMLIGRDLQEKKPGKIVEKEGLPNNLWVRFRDEFFAFQPRHGFEKKPLTLPSPPGEGKRGRSSRKGRRNTRKQRGKGFPLLGESHHGGSATRKLMKMATPLFVAGLTGVIPAFREGIFEVG